MNLLKAYIKKIKLVVLIGLVFMFLRSNAQDECVIYYTFLGDTTNTVYSNDTTICYKQVINLSATFIVGLNYLWEPGGVTQPGIPNVTIKDSVQYILTVFNNDSSFFCKDTLVLNIYPKIEVTFEQISKGCPDECKAQVKATASGGYPPYRYIWSAISPPNDSTIGTGLCTDENARILVKDTICSLDTFFLVKGYSMPEIELTMSPDSLFETNPKATFSFENKSSDSIPLSNWTWLFPDSSSTNLITPEYVFVEEDSVHFIYETIDGCIDTITMPVFIQDFELQLFNVFTPNGDGVNDFYEIPYLDRYISNQLVVFNRWGEKVFEAKNYTNNWDGGNLPDGVYFYVLKCQGYWKEDVFKGSVSIYGSSN
jgi:gliding motility-associated-like protein